MNVLGRLRVWLAWSVDQFDEKFAEISGRRCASHAIFFEK
jgi:hypothetical protein